MPRWLLAFLVPIGLAAVAVLVLWPAGNWTWWRGWLWIGEIILIWAANAWVLWRCNPELLTLRMKAQPGTKGWDRVLVQLLKPCTFGMVVLAGLDAVRFGWTSMAAWWALPGTLLMLGGGACFIWAMGVNAWFELTVRIQTDRGHRVVDTGPYACIRHPGYIGGVLLFLGTPLVLGSAWALVPAAGVAVLLGVRSVLEERVLVGELPGYADYVGRVRWRWIPGLW
jgi:protein-S-isoprenylcysteine O-methyltransferase Ste14